MALNQAKVREILKLTTEGRTTSEVAKIVGCKENQVIYIKSMNPSKDIVTSVIVVGPKWDFETGKYCLIKCQTVSGLPIRICRARIYGNSLTQKTRMAAIQKEFANTLIGHEIEFYTRKESGRLYYHAKQLRLPEKLAKMIR